MTGRPARVTMIDRHGQVDFIPAAGGPPPGYPNLYTAPPATSPNVDIEPDPGYTAGYAGAAGGQQEIRRLPDVVNMTLYRGDDAGFSVAVWDDDGEPADLDGAEIAAQIRAAPDAEPVLGDIGTETDGHVIRCRLHHDTSAGLPAACVFDVEVTFADDWRTTLVAGGIAVTPDVTRRD